MFKFIEKIEHFFCLSFPTKIKYISPNKYDNPWITPEILRLIKYKSLYFNLYKKGIISKELNNSYRNKVLAIIRKSKSNYFETSFKNCKNNIKNTWKLIKGLTGSKINSGKIDEIICNNVEYTNHIDIAEHFNNYFNNIAQELSDNLPINNFDPLIHVHRNLSSIFLRAVTENEISNIILKLKINKSKPNSCPVQILKRVHSSFVPALCNIINLSFQAGSFPDCLKHAVITPLFKKSDRLKMSNYRPISVLSNYSKIFEKCILNRLWNFLNKFNILTTNQFGFLKGRSTEEAISNFNEYIYSNPNFNNYSIAVFRRFSKSL